MNAVEQMSAHHLQAATARLRKSLESFRSRPDSMGIHRENRKRAVLRLDNAVQGRPRGFGNVKKNQRLAIGRARSLFSAHFIAASNGAVSKISRSRPLSYMA